MSAAIIVLAASVVTIGRSHNDQLIGMAGLLGVIGFIAWLVAFITDDKPKS